MGREPTILPRAFGDGPDLPARLQGPAHDGDRRDPSGAGLPPRVAPRSSDLGLIGGDLKEGVILARAMDLEGIMRDGGDLPDWLCGPADDADLPDELRDVAGLIGRPAALLLGAFFGGSRVYFPRNPDPDHRLYRVLGQGRARKLCIFYGSERAGVEIEFPVGPLTFNNFRAARTRAFILQGVPRDRIARLVGMTRRNVNRAAQKLRESGFAVPETSSFPALPEADHDGVAGTFIAAVKPKAEAS